MSNKYRTGKLYRQTWRMLKVLSAHRGQDMSQVADILIREAYQNEQLPDMREENNQQNQAKNGE